MDFDTLLRRYFAADDLSALDATTFARGCEQLEIDFGIEREPGRRFALWVLMEALGIAPEPDEAFDEAPDLRAAADKWRREGPR